jgi:hypothetical protein
MLKYLHLTNVGPSPEMMLKLAPRLNLVTGDNGLGKSFLLDVAWWALTRRWPQDVNSKLTSGYAARPSDIRNTRLPGYVFSPKEVWDGLKVEIKGKETPVCNGLLLDWASWVREGGEDATKMRAVLADLSPSRDPNDLLQPGPLTRISLDDGRDIPSLKTEYAEAIRILHASAGIRRIVALAYMLLWSWNEHRRAAVQLGEETATQVIFLIDELESHLHPRWQRSLLGSLLRLVGVLHQSATTQLLASTHSPLVLASAEPFFDSDRDAWFDFDLKRNGRTRQVELSRRKFQRHGNVSKWLTSDAFDFKEATSIEAEEAMTKALAILKEPAPTLEAVDEVDRLLKASLSEIDRFWVRWTEFRRRHFHHTGPRHLTT